MEIRAGPLNQQNILYGGIVSSDHYWLIESVLAANYYYILAVVFWFYLLFVFTLSHLLIW